MPHLIVRTGEDAGCVHRDVIHGLYVVASRGNDEHPLPPGARLFRVGLAGQSGRGTLHKRLKGHAGAWREGNWTLRHRPWRAIWTAELHGIATDRLTREGERVIPLLAEHALYATIGEQFAFINDSGILGRDEDAARLCAVATDALGRIARVIARQTGESVTLAFADRAATDPVVLVQQ